MRIVVLYLSQSMRFERKCWNRQTGTFEVRVSMTCGFKSHLPHQLKKNGKSLDLPFFSFLPPLTAVFDCHFEGKNHFILRRFLRFRPKSTEVSMLLTCSACLRQQTHCQAFRPLRPRNHQHDARTHRRYPCFQNVRPYLLPFRAASLLSYL